MLNLVILAYGIYNKIKAYIVERETHSMRYIMVRIMEDMNLIKAKLGIGTVEEIIKAKVEAEKKKEAEERKRKMEDK